MKNAKSEYRQLGITALEAMTVVLIIAVISLIAFPVYQNYVRTTSETTVMESYTAFSEEYVARALKDGADLCDADYLSNLDLSRQPDTGLVDTKVDLSPVHGLVFTVATTLDQGPESVRVAIDVYNAFDQRNLVVGTPSVSQSIVSFSVQIGDACTLTKPLNLQTATQSPTTTQTQTTTSPQVTPSLPNCAADQVLSGTTCVTPPSCSGGQILTLDYLSCECPHGQQYDGQNCFTPPPCQGGQIHTADMKSCICPAGQVFDGSQCFTPPVCAGGQVLSSDSTFCHCPAGQLFDGAQCFSPPTCSGGQVLSSDHKSCACPVGQSFDGNNCFTPPNCVGGQVLSQDAKSCTCPTGQLFDGNNCVTPPTCVGGQRLSADGLSCQCPSGTTFVQSISQCQSPRQQHAACQAQCRVTYPHGNSRAYRNCLARCN